MKGFSRRWMSANAKEMKVVNDERKKKKRRFIAEGKDSRFVLMSIFNLPWNFLKLNITNCIVWHFNAPCAFSLNKYGWQIIAVCALQYFIMYNYPKSMQKQLKSSVIKSSILTAQWAISSCYTPWGSSVSSIVLVLCEFQSHPRSNICSKIISSASDIWKQIF